MNSPLHSILLEQGVQVLTVNYSGSWNFGRTFNDRLPGKIGEIDVEEILGVLTKLEGQYDKSKLYYEGGSYGGFLGFTFLQKHPHLFSAMICKNPVINMLHSMASSEIPEWVVVNCLGEKQKFDYGTDLTDDQLLKMKKVSPALNPFDKTSKTRVYMVLGDSDTTIPPEGAYYLYRKLKVLGFNIKCSMYRDWETDRKSVV